MPISANRPGIGLMIATVLSVVLSWLASNSVQADFIIYQLPGLKVPFLIEGKVRSQSSTIVDFIYPGFPAVSISRENVTIIKAPSKAEEYRKLFNAASKSKSIDDYLVAAEFALRGSRLKEFYECCSAAYKIAPDNPTLQRLIEVRKKIKRPVAGFDEAEKKLRDITKQHSMQVARSPHYVLLHDLSNRGSKNTRVEKRLELLEEVYEAFLLKFAFLGIVLEPPTEPMMVLLFGEERNYLRYSTNISSDLRETAGFWSPTDNVAVFFDQGTTEEMKRVGLLIEDLKKAKVRARRTGASKEIAQLTNSLDLLVKISRDQADVEVVSHEATHQLAGNTGLMPREKLGMSWSHEGLASYFESPAGAGWGGVGSINPKRLQGYRSIASDPSKNKLELLISDLLFDASSDPHTIIDAYGSAWALTHFLMQTYPQKLVDYYRKCAELGDTKETVITRKQTIEIFEKVFGDIAQLEREFHHYMFDQKTQVERMMEAASK